MLKCPESTNKKLSYYFIAWTCSKHTCIEEDLTDGCLVKADLMFQKLPEDLILTWKKSWSVSSSGADATMTPTMDKSCRVDLGL